MSSAENMQQQAEEFRQRYTAVRNEIGKVIVGQREVVDEMLIALLAGGHCLITGAPGLAKTLLVKTVAEVFDLSFQRIQFTPDLMPSDITGSEMLEDGPSGKQLVFKKGPVFANMILADEINRTPPKTQAALLEAMQEHQVTAAGRSLRLPEPFFVLATQNPIEQEGTYPLPEAQLDRFLFKLVVGYSSRDDLNTIVERTTRGEKPKIEKVMDGAEIRGMQTMVRDVVLTPPIRDYLVRLTLATHPDGPHSVDATNQYVRWGASPRGAQTLALASKVRAILAGRYNVSFEDIRRVYLPTMRHRVLLNFEAQAEGVETDAVLLEILEKVRESAD